MEKHDFRQKTKLKKRRHIKNKILKYGDTIFKYDIRNTKKKCQINAITDRLAYPKMLHTLHHDRQQLFLFYLKVI